MSSDPGGRGDDGGEHDSSSAVFHGEPSRDFARRQRRWFGRQTESDSPPSWPFLSVTGPIQPLSAAFHGKPRVERRGPSNCGANSAFPALFGAAFTGLCERRRSTWNTSVPGGPTRSWFSNGRSKCILQNDLPRHHAALGVRQEDEVPGFHVELPEHALELAQHEVADFSRPTEFLAWCEPRTSVSPRPFGRWRSSVRVARETQPRRNL